MNNFLIYLSFISRMVDSGNSVDIERIIGSQCKTLDRNMQRHRREIEIEANLISIPKCSTEKMRRKQMTVGEAGSKSNTLIRKSNLNNSSSSNLKVSNISHSHSLGNVKNVTIHPKVTQLSYNDYTPRYVCYIIKQEMWCLTIICFLDAIASLERNEPL